MNAGLVSSQALHSLALEAVLPLLFAMLVSCVDVEVPLLLPTAILTTKLCGSRPGDLFANHARLRWPQCGG
jgi:hypothetical protein